MERLKTGTYLAKIGETLKPFNVYIVKSPDSWTFYVAFDADSFYGGVAFDFEEFPSCKNFNDATKLATEKLNPIWIN